MEKSVLGEKKKIFVDDLYTSQRFVPTWPKGVLNYWLRSDLRLIIKDLWFALEKRDRKDIEWVNCWVVAASVFLHFPQSKVQWTGLF